MLRAGMIKKTAAGIYNWLPFGLKILRKVEGVVRENMNKAGAQEILMPMVQPSDLWKESKRFDEYGKELLKFNDRSDREFVLGPTHEEVVCDIFRSYPISYKDLPINLYQIQTKFRDEIRPRFGVMRAREFTMKDAYSFDMSAEGLQKSYDVMKNAYVSIFNELGLNYRVVKADAGNIGGDISEEFHILADSGEDLLAISDESDFAANVEILDFDKDPSELEGKPSPDGKGKLQLKRGIEVGHIFQLGRKYSEALDARFTNSAGQQEALLMGCYGIGISRLAQAAVEQHHDDAGICWPVGIAPFQVIVVIAKMKDSNQVTLGEGLYQSFLDAGIDALLDDRDERAGVKFKDADLIGIPWRIVVGRDAGDGSVEVVERSACKSTTMNHQEAFRQVKESIFNTLRPEI